MTDDSKPLQFVMKDPASILIPKGCGLCPQCNGTTRTAPEPGFVQYKTMYSGYDAATDTLPCRNCGGQTMSGSARGWVHLNKEGVPCQHEYVGQNAGRCYTIYNCKHCPSSFDIDSSD